MFTAFKKILKSITTTNLMLAVIFLAPICYVLFVMYANYAPSTATTYTLSSSDPFDTRTGRLYLTPTPAVLKRSVDTENRVYRPIIDQTEIVFAAPKNLRQTKLNIGLDADNTIAIPTKASIDLDSLSFSSRWDFSNGEAENLIGSSTSADNALYFDGTSHLFATDTANQFESGPFAVYLEWTPLDNRNTMQQLIGHFNWEIWQHDQSVEFRVGRLLPSQQTVRLVMPVAPDFFGTRHQALAIYAPGDPGYIEFIVDNTVVGRTYIGTDVIDVSYGATNLSFGWTEHNYGKSARFTGFFYGAGISTTIPTLNPDYEHTDSAEETEYRWYLIPTNRATARFRQAFVHLEPTTP